MQPQHKYTIKLLFVDVNNLPASNDNDTHRATAASDNLPVLIFHGHESFSFYFFPSLTLTSYGLIVRA